MNRNINWNHAFSTPYILVKILHHELPQFLSLVKSVSLLKKKLSNCVKLCRTVYYLLSLSLFLTSCRNKILDIDPASQVGQFQFDLWLGYKILLRQVSHELCSIVYLRRILLTGSKANNDWLKQGKISVKTKGIYASTVSKLRGLSTCARCR